MYTYEPTVTNVRFVGVRAAADDVVPLPYSAGAFQRGIVGWNRPARLGQDGAAP